MQTRQVDLQLSVGVTLPLLPDLLQNRCQYITANITATGPASALMSILGTEWTICTSRKLLPSLLFLLWVLKVTPQ